MGGRFKREGLYIYTYGWLMLRFDRKQQNSVKQLSFNKKINSERKKMAVQLSCIEYSCWWFVASLTSFLPGTTSKVGDYSKGFRFLSLSHCFPFLLSFASLFLNLFFNWRTFALQNFVVFCQTSTWVSCRYTFVPSLLNLLPISFPLPPL